MTKKHTTITGVIRADDPIPAEMERLRIDSLGRPIPFFVKDHGTGDPDFRVMNTENWYKAVRNRLCWVCGGRLGKVMGMVGGPAMIMSGLGYDPPAHISCSHWSIRNCPFLVNPMRKVRGSALPGNILQFKSVSTNNPGVGALIHHRNAQFVGTPEDMKVLGYDFVEVEFFSKGQPAEPEDVLRVFHEQWMDFRSMNPHLEHDYLQERIQLANKWLPLEYREEDFPQQEQT